MGSILLVSVSFSSDIVDVAASGFGEAHEEVRFADGAGAPPGVDASAERSPTVCA